MSSISPFSSFLAWLSISHSLCLPSLLPCLVFNFEGLLHSEFPEIGPQSCHHPIINFIPGQNPTSLNYYKFKLLVDSNIFFRTYTLRQNATYCFKLDGNVELEIWCSVLSGTQGFAGSIHPSKQFSVLLLLAHSWCTKKARIKTRCYSIADSVSSLFNFLAAIRFRRIFSPLSFHESR